MATQAASTTLPPSLAQVRAHAVAIREIVQRHGAANPRVFGSVARGDARAGSDVDILVSNVHLSLLRLVRLEDELASLLGVEVDVVLEEEVPDRARIRLMSDVVSL